VAKSPPRVQGLIDAHCHLDYAPMSEDLPGTLADGHAAGVEQFLHVGCKLDAIQRAVDLAEAHEEIFASIGIHPHEATTVDRSALELLERLARHPKVLAIGETGLDFYYDHSPREQQHRALAEHVELARRVDLPLVLHIREAHDEAIAIVREAAPRSERPGMIHCFTGGPTEARLWLDLGFHLSFSGIATFKKATEIREAARLCPDDALLLETDAPYLSPEPVRGLKNRPSHVAFTCVRLAQERGVSPPILAAQAAENTRTLLAMPLPSTH